MAWAAVGNLRGPQGLQGFTGQGVQSASINALGELVIAYTDGTSVNLGRIQGKDGANGTSVSIQGTVANAAALPTNLTAADKGKAYLTQDDGHLRVWDGTTFTDVGTIQGPAGEKGIQGDPGPAGTKWFTGNGAPAASIMGARPGDLYLDLTSGDTYTFGA